jgi:hypothetical protein
MRAGICGKSKWSGTFYKLIAAGADPNERDDLNLSTLHEAAIYGCSEFMKWLLDFDIDPNSQDSNGQTPLHYAALFGHLGCIRLLLRYGADPRTQNQQGETPLDYAIEGRKTMWKKIRIQEGESECLKEERSERLKLKRKKFSVGPKKNHDKIIRLLRRLLSMGLRPIPRKVSWTP